MKKIILLIPLLGFIFTGCETIVKEKNNLRHEICLPVRPEFVVTNLEAYNTFVQKEMQTHAISNNLRVLLISLNSSAKNENGIEYMCSTASFIPK